MVEAAIVFTIIGASVTLIGALAGIVRSALRRADTRGYIRGFEEAERLFEEAQRLVEKRIRVETDAEIRSLKAAVAELQVELAATRSKRWRIWSAV